MNGTTNYRVAVVIPMHTQSLSQNEWKSLHQCAHILESYPRFIVKPYSLDVSHIVNVFPDIQVVSFSDSFFRNVISYNQLMLHAEFYRYFLAFQYILLYQTDAWVFRNELDDWISKEYDYIGAPWIVKPKYGKWYYQLYQSIRSIVTDSPTKSTKLAGKSGNGGFSLRKTDSHYRVCIEKQLLIQEYTAKAATSDLYHEDVFWATEHPEFRYPSYREALQFAWDEHPHLAATQCNGQLPFGCHGWLKTQPMLQFWGKYIP